MEECFKECQNFKFLVVVVVGGVLSLNILVLVRVLLLVRGDVFLSAGQRLRWNEDS